MQVDHGLRTAMDDFGDVQQEIAAFSARFEQLISEKKAALQMAKKQHTDKVASLEQTATRLKAEISAARARQKEVSAEIGSRQEKLMALQKEVGGLDKKFTSAQETSESLKSDIAAAQKRVQTAEDALSYARRHLDLQVQKDIDESTKFEMYAGLKVEALEEDNLRFRFANIDASDIDREVSCELYVGDEFYRIGTTDPELPADLISAMETRLNNQEPFVDFLRHMRKALKDAIE